MSVALVDSARLSCIACALVATFTNCTGSATSTLSPPASNRVDAEPQPSLVPFAPLAASGWNPAHPVAQVGAQLFFDPRLSSSGEQSCGSCHLPHRGFGAGRAVAGRDTPALVNMAYGRHSGERAALERRIRYALEQHAGEDQKVAEIVARLRVDSSYPERMSAAFQNGLVEDSLVTALGEFVARMLSTGSLLDEYLAGDSSALTPEARRGLQQFTGSAGCVRCHNGPLLSDGKFHRACIKGELARRFRRTPSLREVARTGPYMHDGAVVELADVVRSHGGACGADWSPPSEDEVADLLALLTSLNGVDVQYYPIRLPGRRQGAGDLQKDMERIDVLMTKNQEAIQAAVRELSNPALPEEIWQNVIVASVRIEAIAKRLSHLFPPQHLHDLSDYYRLADVLSLSALALERAAREQNFETSFEALGELNNTCNTCHAKYRPVPADEALRQQ